MGVSGEGSDTPGSSSALSQILADGDRLAALYRTGLLDSPVEPSYDRLARLAADFLGAAVSLVSLVTADRQFFKSCVGLPEPWATQRETPLTHSFCQHVVASGQPLIINDARLDERVKDNLAIPDIGVIAYLGIPLAIDGEVIGSFCAIDSTPRVWTEREVKVLTDLAESVLSEIQLRLDRTLLAEQYAVTEDARQQLQVTLRSIGDGVITADSAGLVTFLNPVAENLTGWTSGEAIGRSIASLFHLVDPETRREVGVIPAEFQHTVPADGLAQERILVTPAGKEHRVESRVSPILAADNQPRGLVVIMRDVTTRRQIDRALAKNEQRLRVALDAARMVAWEWSPEDGTLHVSDNAAELYGLFPGDSLESIAQGLAIVHPGDLDSYRTTYELAIRDCGSYRHEYRICRPSDGRIVWIEERGDAKPTGTGRGIRLTGVATDITARKEAEDRLRQSEERYRTLFDSIDAGFCVFTMLYDDAGGNPYDYRFQEVNFAFEQQSGLRDAAGRTIRELAPTIESSWFEIYGNVDRTRQPIRFQQGSAALDGRVFEAFGFPIGEPEEHTVGVLFTDITARKQTEREKEDLVAQLRDADLRKDEFLAMLAHELRNPLGVISNSMQLVALVGRPEVLGELREIIQHQVKHLTHLIDDLLDVSRITQGKIELKKQTVELTAVVHRAVELVKPLVQEKRHDLRVSLPTAPVWFVADPTRTEQILGNLLTNAAKYSPPDGSIQLTASVAGGEVVLQVRDQGDGIAPEMLPKIFDLFTQVDATIDRARGGLGIGLTLVKNLVEMHGGSILGVSEGKGKGAEFTVRLPIGQPIPPQATAPAPNGRPRAIGRGDGTRILIVDDNVETARLAARLLRAYGYEVEVAHDGVAGIEAARRYRPRAILLDIGLPGMNGYQLASQLRQEACGKDALLVAVSGYGEEASRERSRTAGFNHHLTKPVDFEEVRALLGKLVGTD